MINRLNKNEKRYLGILILLLITVICYYIVSGSPEIELYTSQSIMFLLTPVIVGGASILAFIAADLIRSDWTFYYIGILGIIQVVLAVLLREGCFLQIG